MTKCLMSGKELLKIFWTEAVYSLMYLLNKFYKRLVKEKTPLGDLEWFKAFIKHFRIFGSIYYTLNSFYVKMTKLNDNGHTKDMLKVINL